MNETYEGGRRIADELRSLVSEAEVLLRSTGNGGTPELKERAQMTLQEMRVRLNALETNLRARAQDVDTYVHDNPWQAVGIAGGVALLLGLLMGLGRR
ncbi:MAG TPA: hypothetical protein VKB72_04790 [Steroidobacteraceae bacterium]|nr:hypothetical protein [Steroidobacteraceae bacterium]